MDLIGFIQHHGKEEAFTILTQPPYNIEIEQHPEYGWNKFYYHMVESDLNEPITHYCRGCILNEDCTEYICRPMDKTFNYTEETRAYPVDLSKSVAYEKIDGSFINIFYAEGKWHVKLNKHYTMDVPINFSTDSHSTFEDLLNDVVNLDGLYTELESCDLDTEQFTFMFELVHPLNTIVVMYEPHLYFLGMIHNETGKDYSFQREEMQYMSRQFDHLGIKTPRHFDVDEIDDILKIAEEENHNEVKLEGFMVCELDNDGYIKGRVKVKDAKYLSFHKIQDPKTAKNVYYEVFRTAEEDEFEAYLKDAPDILKKEYYKLKAFWVEILKEFAKHKEQHRSMYLSSIETLGESDARKQQALYIRDHTPKYLQGFLLTMVFDNLTLHDVLLKKQSYKPVKKLIEGYKQYTQKERSNDV